MTLNYAPQAVITLDLANVSGILKYVLKNISDQQYRSAIVFYTMAWSPVNRLVNTNQGIWNNHTDKHNKNRLKSAKLWGLWLRKRYFNREQNIKAHLLAHNHNSKTLTTIFSQ